VADVTYECSECGFRLFLPIARLSMSTLGLYDDARFPGRCLLVFHDHVEDLTELSTAAATGFLWDMRVAAAVIRQVTAADHINYAILGNAEPHLHAHLIPRNRKADPVPRQSPWSHPEPSRPLPETERDSIIHRIAANIGKGTTR